MLTFITTQIVLIALVVVLVAWLILGYNGLVRLRNRFVNAFAQIDVQLKGRFDLVPNLVEAAKGYLKHENKTLESVTLARAAAVSASDRAAANPRSADAVRQLAAEDAGLSGALGRLFALIESYPELKADKTIAKACRRSSVGSCRTVLSADRNTSTGPFREGGDMATSVTKRRRTLARFAALTLLGTSLAGASSARAQMELIVDLVVDGGNSYNWQRVALPGTICGNGSQYKFWYYDSPTSNNMVVMFEGGGACWDYDTCSGRAGVLGASNPNGLPDNYIDGTAARYVSPIVNGADPGMPFRAKRNIAKNGWDVVYMPYCTGDVHTGNSVATYYDLTGANPPLVWRHAGYNNTVAAATFLRGRFPSINKLLVTGFSAGGVASSSIYYQARRTLVPAKGYLLNDSVISLAVRGSVTPVTCWNTCRTSPLQSRPDSGDSPPNR